ncbi:hypothetical protein IQ07DRAFT_347654 [Pyrenochaeta sp. DS3sAY3a]|nr:hypothetical protein IQ07DRAFT_347654 [Pyrenochaeta sp. DS3sAY3a]
MRSGALSQAGIPTACVGAARCLAGGSVAAGALRAAHIAARVGRRRGEGGSAVAVGAAAAGEERREGAGSSGRRVGGRSIAVAAGLAAGLAGLGCHVRLAR